ncbi:terminase small subunit, partial [Escherichia coli]
ILDGIPLSVQRRFPELENRHVDFLKRDIIKAMNKAAALDELITAHRRQRPHKLHRQTTRQPPKNQKPTRKIARQQQRAVKQTRRNLRRTHLIIATRRK